MPRNRPTEDAVAYIIYAETRLEGYIGLYDYQKRLLDVLIQMNGNDYAAAKHVNKPVVTFNRLMDEIETRLHLIAMIEHYRGLS